MTKLRIALGMGLTLLLTFTAHARIIPGVPDDWSQSVFLGYGLTQTNHDQTLSLANTPAPGLSNRYDNANTASSAVLLGVAMDKLIKKRLIMAISSMLGWNLITFATTH